MRTHCNHNFSFVWVTDVTYYKFNDKVLFICAIIDLYIPHRAVGDKTPLEAVTIFADE